MSEEIVETESQGFLSRLGGAIGGIFVGILMILIAFPLVFWNEGRDVKTARAISEGASAAVHVEPDKVDSANEGGLVHVNGKATTDETLADATFGISKNAIALKRDVEMYQWKEDVDSKTTKKTGGKKETKKTYSYTKEWSSKAIDSAGFKTTEGHENPGSMLYDSENWRAKKVTLGAFTLDNSLASSIGNWTDLNVTEDMLAKANLESQADKVKIQSGKFYFGADAGAPAIGDLRVSFKVVEPGPVSVLAEQKGANLVPDKNSEGYSVSELVTGTKTMAEMFEAQETGNMIMTWVLRFGGFALMFMGLSAILGPIRVLADIVPFFGSIVGAGIFVLSFMGAAMCTLPTIAVAWLFYRPIIGIILLTLTAVAFAAFVVTLVGMYRMWKSRQDDAEPAAA